MTPADAALPVPDGLDWPEAAAIPEAFLTAWDALVHRARITAGERVLIHAVVSGAGTMSATGDTQNLSAGDIATGIENVWLDER